MTVLEPSAAEMYCVPDGCLYCEKKITGIKTTGYGLDTQKHSDCRNKDFFEKTDRRETDNP